MDNELFLKRLSELAEWHRPQTGPNGALSVSKKYPKTQVEHPGPITQEELESMSDDEAQQYYEKLLAWKENQPNSSIAPVIVNVKPQPTNCDDCGKHCELGRRTEKKLYESGSKHWREFCKECQKFRDPLTGQFTLEKNKAHQYFIDFYRPKLGKYKSKYQSVLTPKPVVEPKPKRVKKEPVLTKTELMAKIISEGHWETRETEDTITRTFVPKSN